MSKEKLNLSLDVSIKDDLMIMAEERHMSVSALITYWVMLNRDSKILKKEDAAKEKEKL